MIGESVTTWIRRIRVSGGYLKDLDVEFDRGLNVVVGARGTGKSTLLRLIRFALGVESAAEDRTQEDHDVAAILGSGEVTLDIETPSGLRLITVNGLGEGRVREFATSALALGQNELEAVASSSDERRQLLDLRASLISQETDYPSDVAETTQRLFLLRQQAGDLRDKTFGREQLKLDLASAEAEESRLTAKATESLADNRKTVAQHDGRLTQISSSVSRGTESMNQVKDLLLLAGKLSEASASLKTANLPDEFAAIITETAHRSRTSAKQLIGELEHALITLTNALESLKSEQAALLAIVAPIRADLDASAVGLGEVTSKLRGIRTQLEDLDSTTAQIAALEAESTALRKRREASLDQLEKSQHERFLHRADIAASISVVAGDDVTISVSHQSDTSDYWRSLERALKGSGIQYRPLVDRATQKLLPRELLRIAEHQNSDDLATVLGIPKDRATRFLAAFDSADSLADLAQIQLADSVDFILRQGGEDRLVQELSTGQKCAVTLPILISDESRTLILDQPEDHLDNEFLVSNIVTGLKRRTAGGAQSIIATHNPNIPVLGDAAQVIHLKSDGRSGRVNLSGRVDARPVKTTITSILEGGADAFELRAKFYGNTDE
ncbi:AAA family ATPase [Arthrobacter sp. ES3-54]|uniref:AAA family ATPase n=1 Tax=Arthrobacter sp. ES3-54 TaxID=1502991 RepID=UPI0024057281|nr:AAA family ATPase [Arthrobacter sp. ES3-54]MDF9751457.1 DNA repair exonuclease SbcCD ATPase subunit [Arthrobacter sp. ES3-54]